MSQAWMDIAVLSGTLRAWTVEEKLHGKPEKSSISQNSGINSYGILVFLYHCFVTG